MAICKIFEMKRTETDFPRKSFLCYGKLYKINLDAIFSLEFLKKMRFSVDSERILLYNKYVCDFSHGG